MIRKWKARRELARREREMKREGSRWTPVNLKLAEYVRDRGVTS